jgi:hypothetical protein
MPAFPIKRIEKEFFLQGLYTSRTPIIYFADKTEYILRIDKPVRQQLVLKAEHLIPGIAPKQTLSLMFDFMGEIIRFSIEVKTLRYEYITADIPDFLYKNLDRSYLRTMDGSIKVQFVFREDRLSLQYPKLTDYTGEETAENEDNFCPSNSEMNPKNLKALSDQIADWIMQYASGYKVVIFEKNHPPETVEERLLAGTGKIFYLPSTLGGLPETDSYPPPPPIRLITGEMLRRHLEGDGVAPEKLDEEAGRFIKQKRDDGFLSDAWAPIPFREYIVGYIHMWIKEPGKAPFSYETIETLYQFGKLLAHSFRLNGYFNSGKPKNVSAEGQIIDVSVSGVLFAYPRSQLPVDMIPNGELSVILTTPARTINAAARIARHWQNEAMDYFGCAFLDMDADDMRYLFEYLYGKPPSSEDRDKDKFLTGKV